MRFIKIILLLFVGVIAYGQGTPVATLERPSEDNQIVGLGQMLADSTYLPKWVGLDSLYEVRNDSLCVIDGVCFAEVGGSGGGLDSFDSNRPISRIPTVGTNIGGETVVDFLEWWYIGNAQAPSVFMNNFQPTMVEVGTTNTYTISGGLNNPCNYTIGSQLVDGSAWTAASSYSVSRTYSPTAHGGISYTATAAWTDTGSTCASGGAASGTASTTRNVIARWPVLWGMSATVYTSGNVPYNIWSKRVTSEGNQSNLSMTGTSQYIYILIPKSWSDVNVTSIIDHNGFNVTPSFTAYDVTVTGMQGGLSQDYKLYKLNNLTTANGFAYTYNR